MPKLRSAVIFTICLTLLASAGSVFAGGRGQRTPIRFAPNSLDQQPVTAVNPLDGSVWTAWAWRDGAEYSIALSIQSEGVWSEPFFIGRDDNLNQVSPAIVFDDRGVAYLAWTVLPESQVMIVAIAESPQAGLNLRTVSTRNIPSTEPALAVVRDRLVVAFQADRKTVLRDLPLYRPNTVGTNGIQEGPDAVDPLGWSWANTGTEPGEDESGEHWTDDPDENDSSSNTRPFGAN